MPHADVPISRLRRPWLLGVRLLALAALALAGSSCQQTFAADRLEISSEPRAARAFVDGQLQGETELAVPVRYYGPHLIEVERDPYLPGRQYFETYRELVEVPPPASRWLFPFDFVLEVGRRILGWEPPHVEARLRSHALAEERPALRTAEAIEAADRAARERR